MNKRSDFVKIMRQTLKAAHFNIFIFIYIISISVFSILIYLVEPNIGCFKNSLWYCFIASTSIGFGDYTAATTLGRILTVVMYLFSLVVLSMFTAVATKILFESIKLKGNESTALLIEDLENLENLPKERLAEISSLIREKNRK